jgi:membrane protease YdiL (CAAX protease family)
VKTTLGSRALYAAVAAALVAWAPVERPAPRLPSPLALLLGGAAGAGLFVGLARRLPPLPAPGVVRAVVLATPVVGLAAACEETIWRFGLLGGLRSVVGTGAAFAIATAAFAVAHVGRAPPRKLFAHCVTGATFGGVYVGSGRLGAAVAVHAAYNLLVVAACAAWPEPLGDAEPEGAT